MQGVFAHVWPKLLKWTIERKGQNGSSHNCKDENNWIQIWKTESKPIQSRPPVPLFQYFHAQFLHIARLTRSNGLKVGCLYSTPESHDGWACPPTWTAGFPKALQTESARRPWQRVVFWWEMWWENHFIWESLGSWWTIIFHSRAWSAFPYQHLQCSCYTLHKNTFCVGSSSLSSWKVNMSPKSAFLFWDVLLSSSSVIPSFHWVPCIHFLSGWKTTKDPGSKKVSQRMAKHPHHGATTFPWEAIQNLAWCECHSKMDKKSYICANYENMWDWKNKLRKQN